MELSDITEAMRPINADYLRDVRTIAQEIWDEHRGDDEAISQAVHENVDGSFWVIYTYAAQAVCLISDNDGAIEDNDASLAFSDGAINWSVIAYYAMEADVNDYLDVLRSTDDDGSEGDDDDDN